jgi:hypothetical protein
LQRAPSSARTARRIAAALSAVVLSGGAAAATTVLADDFTPTQKNPCAWVHDDGRRAGASGSTACTVLAATASVPAPDGGSVLILAASDPARMTAQRRVALPPGERLQLKLTFAAPPGVAERPRLRVRVGDSIHTVDGLPGGTWTTRIVSFTAATDPAPGLLVLVAASEAVVVDSLLIESTSEIASLPGLVAGLLWMGWALNRRRAHPLVPQLNAPR